MSRTTSWLCVALFCTGATGAGRDNPAPAPPPREKPAGDAWLPKPGSYPLPDKWVKEMGLAAKPPSAFPDLVVPEQNPPDRDKRSAEFQKLCPRLFEATVLKVEATDDTFRKLLKARLHQGTLEFQYVQRGLNHAMGGQGPDSLQYQLCLLDMQAAATELWAKEPKELVPWLEELLLAAKEWERLMEIRARNRGIAPTQLHLATRTRLKMEAELWKAKNPK